MDVTDMNFDECPDTTSLAASDFYDVNYMLLSLTETSTGTVTTLDQTVPSSIFSSLTQSGPPMLNIIASDTELTAGTYKLTYLASFTEETSSEIYLIPTQTVTLEMTQTCDITAPTSITTNRNNFDGYTYAYGDTDPLIITVSGWSSTCNIELVVTYADGSQLDTTNFSVNQIDS